eukprot:TRINITY_DN60312_c0_g1_i1.p1 TRINITY_DN60312_c0_g1~~TRINITY_DN60312_c0_g1_i1.p1  ORF type:complete len:488 (+),score=135.59 TRINITY_DN60312_c0_g1_i1:89-1465(+)
MAAAAAPASAADLLAALQRTVDATKGVAPYNYLPTSLVHQVLQVVRITSFQQPPPSREPDTAPPLVFREEAHLQSDVPRLAPGQMLHIAALWLKPDGTPDFFVPWSSQLLLRRGHEQACRLHYNQRLRDTWYFDAGPVLRGAPKGERIQIRSEDTRMPVPGKRLPDLRRVDAIVLLIAGAEPRPVPEVLVDLKSQLSRVAFKDEEEDEELSLGLIELKFKDPVSLQLIRTPVRGRGCSHAQCFDLEFYITLVSEQRQPVDAGFRCMQCQRPLLISDFVVDSTFEELLRMHAAVSAGDDSIRLTSSDYTAVFGRPGRTDPGAVSRLMKRAAGPAAEGAAESQVLSGLGQVVWIECRGQRAGLHRIDAVGRLGTITRMAPHGLFPDGEAWICNSRRSSRHPEFHAPVAGTWALRTPGFEIWRPAEDQLRRKLVERHRAVFPGPAAQAAAPAAKRPRVDAG